MVGVGPLMERDKPDGWRAGNGRTRLFYKLRLMSCPLIKAPIVTLQRKVLESFGVSK
jgi:hypothetical protein